MDEKASAGPERQPVVVNGRRNGWTRPVALPEDPDETTVEKAHGIVSLPLNVFWGGPSKSWDQSNRHQRAQVYEIVLTEGDDDDIRRFIDLDELIDLWPDLWRPPHVRLAWASHVRRLRGVELGAE
jgi:hypothetical protein